MSPAVISSLLRHHGGDVDFEQHSLNCQSGNHQKRIGGNRSSFTILRAPAFADVRLVSNIGDIDHLLDHVEQKSRLFMATMRSYSGRKMITTSRLSAVIDSMVPVTSSLFLL